MGLHEEMLAIGDQAVAAARRLALLTTRKKNQILLAVADELEASKDRIGEANARDMESAAGAGLSAAMLDRLRLTESRILGMAKGLRDVAGLKDPVGGIISRWIRPNGLEILKVRVPIGVVAIFYEARPNVTADAAGLCLKSSNAVILRGGKEALESNKAIVDVFRRAGGSKGLPPHAVQLVETTDRDAIRVLAQMEGRVDLIIPRGGEGLIRAVVDVARVPVIKHYRGVCHVYVDADADLDMALRICENAKCQRPGVCNAMETLLVHRQIARTFLPMVWKRLGEERRVELRGDDAAREIVPAMRVATEEDWNAEYLDLILAVRVVPDVAAAIDHINRYGSNHSDAVVSSNETVQRAFAQGVGSAVVYINASTRFTDGGEFGMGAEIGISTDKLHARGPMGLEELTTYKYVVHGDGQVRE